MIIKSLQILGNLFPISLLIFSFYLFGDIDPDTPRYAGSVLVLWFMAVAGFGVGFVLLFVLPSSLILLKRENREYFSFQSKWWISSLAVNWLLIGFYCLCILVFVITSVN